MPVARIQYNEISEIEIPKNFINRYQHKEYVNYIINSIKPYWGNLVRDYFIPICKDDKFSGRHHNFFTYTKKELRKYIFKNSAEVDIAFCHPLLLADLLFEAFGNNDFTNTLFNDNYDIYTLIGKTRDEGKSLFNTTIYGVSYPNRFSQGFPEASNYIRKIKQGDDRHFKRFTMIKDEPNRRQPAPFADLKQKVIKTDKRLTLDENDKQYNRAKSKGELHYKIIALMLQLKEVEIMRKVWTELRKEHIIFVPIHDSVVVDNSNIKRVEEIFKEVWSNNLNRKFKIRVAIKNSSCYIVRGSKKIY